MVEKFKYTYLLFIGLLIFIRCSYDNPYSNPLEPDPQNPPPDTLFYSVQGTLICENEPIQYAQVSLNSITTYSDSTGYFLLDSLVSGSYNLTVNSGLLYELFDTTFFIDSNLTIDIELNRRAYDYLPLMVGNKWRYFWEAGGYAEISPGNYSFWETNGSVEWEIIQNYEQDPYRFKFLETYHDSTTDTIITKYFDVRQEGHDSIKFLSGSLGSFQNQIIRRYNPVNTPEIIVYYYNSWNEVRYSYKRNVGLIEYFEAYNGITWGYSNRLVLLEFLQN